MSLLRLASALVVASLTLIAPASAQQVLKVGTAVAGFGFPDAKTGAVQGYSVDVMTAIAKDSGLQIQIVPFASFGDVLPALLAKQIDISATATTITPERRAMGVDFSLPYAIWTDCLVVLKSDTKPYKSMDEFKGEVVSAGNGTNYLDGLRAKTGFKEVKAYPSTVEALQAMSKGEVKAYITNTVQMAYFQKGGQYLDYRVVETYVPTYPSIGGIAVRKGETELLNKINAGLTKMKGDGSLKAIAAKWNMLLP
jgi:polar amino acid transport system substrate-binding protein